MRRKTKRLSTESDISMRYPVRNNFAWASPNCQKTKPQKPRASDTQTMLQLIVSFRVGACERRLTIPTSTKSAVNTTAKKKTHTQNGYSIAVIQACQSSCGSE